MDNLQKYTPVSEKVLMEMRELVGRTERLAGSCKEKLEPILNSQASPTDAAAETTEPYPPLFDEYRKQCRYISEALDIIQDAINQAEL